MREPRLDPPDDYWDDDEEFDEDDRDWEEIYNDLMEQRARRAEERWP